MKEKWPLYRRRIYFLLLALAFGLGVHGLYVYYRPIISRDWQLISAMLYGTMKLFLFAPPLGVTAEVSLSYEIAKWLAPMLTSALVLTALANRVLHLKNLISNLFGNHLVVFGASPQSLAFLRAIKGRHQRLKKTLVSPKPLSDDARHAYEKMGVAVFHEDIRQLSPSERASLAKQIRLTGSQHILFLDEDETINYQTLLALLPELKLTAATKVHLQLETPVLRRYVEQAMERRKLANPGYQLLDVRFFSPAGLTVERLLAHGGVVHFLQPRLDQLAQGEYDLTNLPPVHLFILGVNNLSKELILRSINDFVISRRKLQITLVDASAQEALDDLLYQYPELSRAVDITANDSLPGKPSFGQLAARGDYTALFLNHANPLLNLQALEYFPRYLPTAFRNQTGLDLNEIRQTNPGVIFYGDLAGIMTRSIVLQESLDQAARAFNARYDQVASVLGSGGSAWEELSPTKKQSSRLSAGHAFVKLALLQAALGEPEEDVRQRLAQAKETFDQLVAETSGEDFKRGLIRLFKDQPYLEALSELEHIRWCYSYYAMGFRYGETKDEINKTHPCLIESWDHLMEQAFFTCHPEYDLISVLSLAGESHEAE